MSMTLLILLFAYGVTSYYSIR